MQVLLFSLQESTLLRALQRLYDYIRRSNASGTFHPRIEPEEEDNDDLSICSSWVDSTLSVCSPPPHTIDSIPIPFTLHSDVPVSAVCSNDFFYLRSTSPVEFPPMLPSCFNRDTSDSGMLLKPSIWLILGSYAFIIMCIKVYQTRMQLDPIREIFKLENEVQPRKPGELVYISGALLPTPEEVIRQTLESYGHSVELDAADNYRHREPLIRAPGPKTLASSPSWHNTLRNNPDVLFRGPITQAILKNAKTESTKPPMLYQGPPAPTMMTQSDVPPLPPNIPIVNINPTNCVNKPEFAPCRPVAGPINTNTNAPAPSRYRPLPINPSAARPSVLTREPSYRCFNPSPLKNVSISVPSPSTSPPCTPELRTPAPRSPALSGNGLNKNIWARGV